METLIALLKQHLTQYGVIPEAAWQALKDSLRRMTTKKDHKLSLRPGGLYFLGKGLVKECVDWKGDGEETILRLVPERTVMFAPSSFSGRCYKALEACELLELDWQSALILSLRHVALREHYEQLLSEWLQLLPDRVDLLHVPRHQRKEQFLAKNPTLKKRVPAVDLANYLAISHDFAVC